MKLNFELNGTYCINQWKGYIAKKIFKKVFLCVYHVIPYLLFVPDKLKYLTNLTFQWVGRNWLVIYHSDNLSLLLYLPIIKTTRVVGQAINNKHHCKRRNLLILLSCHYVATEGNKEKQTHLHTVLLRNLAHQIGQIHFGVC